MKITFCIPSKNNLRYLKNSIESVKKNSSYEHDVVVFIDSDNDGTEQWCIDNSILYLKNTDKSPKGIAYGYNRCIEIAKTEVVCMFHADMYMAKGFDIGIAKHLKPGKVVSATRIEPPLHPEGKEKIVKHFGMYPEDFQEEKFNTYVEALLEKNVDKITKGIFAPWAILKSDIVAIGMHDESFHSYHEDSDIFNRFILKGYELVQTWESYVYHLTCRGGQFQDGVESITQDPSFHLMKTAAMRNYLRKWGTWIKNDEYQHPILTPKYDIGFVVTNCNSNILAALEPWCSTLYTDDEMGVLEASYYQSEHLHTRFNLKKKLKVLKFSTPANDVVVRFDGKDLSNESFVIIQQLSEIIAGSGQPGEFKLDIFKIQIQNLTTYEHNLINNSDVYYTSQLV